MYAVNNVTKHTAIVCCVAKCYSNRKPTVLFIQRDFEMPHFTTNVTNSIFHFILFFFSILSLLMRSRCCVYAKFHNQIKYIYFPPEFLLISSLALVAQPFV